MTLPIDIKGDPKTKVCQYCEKGKPLSEFPLHSQHKDGHDSRCKVCINKRSAFVAKVKLHAPPKPDLCQRPGCPRKASVCDHDPAIEDPAMAFRGWLCDECNRSIGQLGDTIESAVNTLNYLVEAKWRNYLKK